MEQNYYSRLLLLLTAVVTAECFTSVSYAEAYRSRKYKNVKGYLVCSYQAVELECNADEHVYIIHADYGRTDNFICGGGEVLDCTSRDSTTRILRQRCQESSTCEVKGNGDYLPDMCPGVEKYIHIVYTCQKREELTREPARQSPGFAAIPQRSKQPMCGVSKSFSKRAKRVVRGQKAVPGSWPWQVALLKGFKRKRFLCGGTLIHPKWVLTAAHCIKNKNYEFLVRLGEHDRWVNESVEQDIKVKRVILHPEYYVPYPLNNDIALLELEKQAELNNRVGVACLPQDDNEININNKETTCYISGWGRRSHKGYMSLTLRQAEIPAVNREICEERLAKSPGGRNRKITQAMLCGGDDDTGSGACQGDSGGPYVCRNKQGYWELIGITSWGSATCTLKQRYTVFAKVSHFMNWIKQYVKL